MSTKSKSKNDRASILSFIFRKIKISWLLITLFLLTTVIFAKFFVSSSAERKRLEKELEVQKEMFMLLKEKTDSEDSRNIFSEPEPIITSEIMSEQLNAIGNLVTSEYIYTTAGKYENNGRAKVILWEMDVPFTKKSFIVSYDGRITAGINIDDILIDIDEEKRVIDVTLPSSKILSNETFEDTLEVLDESDGVFNRITIEDYNSFVSSRKSQVEERAISHGVLSNADKEIKSIIKTYLSIIPGIDTYRLNIN